MLEKLFNFLGSKLVGRSDLSGQFLRYRETVFWLLSSLFTFDKWRLLGALLSNISGVTIQGGALTLLMIYGGFMENNRQLVIFGNEVSARDHNLFFMAMILIGMLLALGGVLKFFGSKLSMRLATDFAGHCSFRVLTMSATYPIKHPRYNEQDYPSVMQARITGLVLVARSIRPLLATSNPITMILYGLAALFYLDAGLTLILLLLSIPTLFGQYIVNYHVVQNEKKLVVAQRLARRELGREIELVSSQPSLSGSEFNHVKNLYEEGSPNDHLRHYAFRKLAGPKSSLISDLSTAVTAILIISILGNAALDGSINWITFLAFLVFARLTLLSFRGAMQSFTGFARHYPKIRGAYELLKYARSGQSGSDNSDRSKILLAAKNSDSIGDIRKQEISIGSVTGVFSKSPISRYNSSLYLSALQVSDSSIREFLVKGFECLPRKFTYDSNTLGQHLEQFVAQRGVEAAAGLLQLFGLEKSPLAHRLKYDRLTAQVDLLSPGERKNLSAAIVILTSPGSILMVDFKVYMLIEDQWAQLLEMLEKPKFIFICFTKLSDEFIASCEHLMIGINIERDVALATPRWVADNREKFDQFTEIRESEDDSEKFDDDDDD